MATITGLLLSSIFRRNGSRPAPRDLPEVILPNSLISAPAMKVRPPPISTAALMVSSCAIRLSASEIPSGTPGLSALTGGLLMVMTAMSFSFVSCTRSFMEKSLFANLRAFRGDGAGIYDDGIDHLCGNPLAMKSGVAECRFRTFGAAVVQVHIVLPGETHAAVNLDAAIANRAGGVTRVHFGDGNGGRCVRGIFLERPSGIVHRRAGTLGFQIHVCALVLDGLKCTDGFAELFAGFGVFYGDFERALHATDQFGGKRGGGDVEGAFEIGGGADFFGGRVMEFDDVELAREVHGGHRRNFQARGFGIHDEHAVARDHDDEIGDCRVGDETFFAGELSVGCRELNIARIPASVGFEDGDGGARLSAADEREIFLFVRGRGDGVED